MASLKDLKNRIDSVKSTRKITQAMKMVAAAKLRRAQEQAEAARPYAERMQRMLAALAASVEGRPDAPKMLAGTGSDQSYLVVLCTADRGLCGGFNSNLVREADRRITQLRNEGKTVKVLAIGRKGNDQMRRLHPDMLVEGSGEIGKELDYTTARAYADRITKLFQDGEFDVCQLVYSRFKSAMRQIVTVQQLVPFSAQEELAEHEQGKDDARQFVTGGGDGADSGDSRGSGGTYDFEPDEESILNELLPRNLAVQIFRSLLENNAGEQGARMTAMDGATRNAEDMIEDLTQTYNRTRQAVITTELNEIVSAAESMK
ncbi:F0F1 ATP synthase subunit gamma [Rhodovibrio sodomensis]|uniref:ATP synthase gamma chain n=1 Tax=Rhodovibrio sodomensis TaxID=1088 RepID=A0ABS1DH19_9PROT|nr:F0F1 ATP synthase subunit gamma [Rhodovibrio sodomensis]